jgi:hypothetical protein
MSVDLPAPFSPSRAWTSPLSEERSTPSLATTPGNRLVMPCSSTADPEPLPVSGPAAAGGLLLDVEMTHSPETPLLGGGFSSCRGHPPVRSRRRARAPDGHGRIRRSTRLWIRPIGSGTAVRSGRDPGPEHRPSGRQPGRRFGHFFGVSATLILPSTIPCFALSMSLWMSSMKPPEVASETPSCLRSKAVVPFIGLPSLTLLIRS